MRKVRKKERNISRARSMVLVVSDETVLTSVYCTQ